MATSHFLPSPGVRALALAGATVCDAQETSLLIKEYAERFGEWLRAAVITAVTVRFVVPCLKRTARRQDELITYLRDTVIDDWDPEVCRSVVDVIDEMIREERDLINGDCLKAHLIDRLIGSHLKTLNDQLEKLSFINEEILDCASRTRELPGDEAMGEFFERLDATHTCDLSLEEDFRRAPTAV